MDIRREWKRKAPRFDPNGQLRVRALVADFKWRRSDPESPIHKNRDTVVDYCAEAPNIREAVKRACASRRPNGKMHNHQSRVPHASRAALYRDLMRSAGRGTYPVSTVCSFEDLLSLVDRVGSRIAGIGPVTIYDVATRIAAYLDLEPKLVHMHAGCLEGARALGFAEAKVGDALRPRLFPLPVRNELTADEIEDFLCVYRNVLGEASWV